MRPLLFTVRLTDCDYVIFLCPVSQSIGLEEDSLQLLRILLALHHSTCHLNYPATFLGLLFNRQMPGFIQWTLAHSSVITTGKSLNFKLWSIWTLTRFWNSICYSCYGLTTGTSVLNQNFWLVKDECCRDEKSKSVLILTITTDLL